MCIALPCQILAVADSALMLITVSGDAESDPQIVSAALLVTPEQSVEQLVGAFVLVHAGFALTLIGEEEAQSRLQVFAALRGDNNPIDLDDFYAATADAQAVHGEDGERRAAPDDAPPPIPEVSPHV